MLHFFCFFRKYFIKNEKKDQIAHESPQICTPKPLSATGRSIPSAFGGERSLLLAGDPLPRSHALEHGDLRRGVRHCNLSHQRTIFSLGRRASRTARRTRHHHLRACHGMHGQPLARSWRVGLFPPPPQSVGTDLPLLLCRLVSPLPPRRVALQRDQTKLVPP